MSTNEFESCWDVLGIEQTTVKRDIKRAYTKLLKVTNPEDDAEGFKRIRDAFDNAIANAKFMANFEAYDEEDGDDTGGDTEIPEAKPVAPPEPTAELKLEPEPEPESTQIPEPKVRTKRELEEDLERAELEALLAENDREQDVLRDKLESLLNDKKTWASAGPWQTFLSNPLMQDMSFRNSIERRIYHAIDEFMWAGPEGYDLSAGMMRARATQYAPYVIWEMWSKEFGWADDYIGLQKRLGHGANMLNEVSTQFATYNFGSDTSEATYTHDESDDWSPAKALSKYWGWMKWPKYLLLAYFVFRLGFCAMVGV